MAKTKEEIDKEYAEELNKLNQLLMLGTDSGIEDFVVPVDNLNQQHKELQDNIQLTKELQGLKDWESNEGAQPSEAELVDIFKKYADINKDSVEVNLPDDLMYSDASDARESNDTPSMNDLRIWEITNKYRPGYGYKSGIASLDTDTSFVNQPASVPEPEDKPDPVAKKIKEVNDEIRRIEVANDTKIQADYKALARKQDALWQYAVYRAANGDTSLFDKLVGDAEARREAERNREFQAAEAEKNRQSAERQSAGARSEADRSEFVSAKKKAERALQDLNDINDSTRAKWANGSATSDDVLNLRRAYRAYQYALDDAEAAARKISEAYDSGDIFDKTTGDLGINLDAMKGLDFNGVYTGERNLPYTATMASNVVSSKQISDALNSADPEKAKESSLMLGNELEKFNTSHPSNMGLEEIQRIQNLFQDKIDQLNAVTAPTTNQKRHKENETELDSAKLDYADLQTAIGKLYNDPKYQKNGKQDMNAIDAKAKELVKKYSKNHPSYPAAYTRDKGLIAPKWGN